MCEERASAVVAPMPEEARRLFRVPEDFSSVAAALDAAAAAHGSVVVGAGTFREASPLKLRRGVSLEGSGAATILESDSHTVVACAEGAVRVADLLIRQTSASASEPAFGLEVRGDTIVERCDISARCGLKNCAGVLVRGASARVTLRECTVTECAQTGVLIAAGARAVLEQCALRACSGCGALVLSGSVLEMRGGSIRTCGDSALCVVGRAAATLVGAELDTNGGTAGAPTVALKPAGPGGAAAAAAGRLVMKESRVTNASGSGVQASDGAEVHMTGCTLRGCAKAAVALRCACRVPPSRDVISDPDALLRPSPNPDALAACCSATTRSVEVARRVSCSSARPLTTPSNRSETTRSASSRRRRYRSPTAPRRPSKRIVFSPTAAAASTSSAAPAAT